jgi:hypothetical protein
MPLNNREILEEMAGGDASMEFTPPGKYYCRFVINLPETSKATVVEFMRAIQEAT